MKIRRPRAYISGNPFLPWVPEKVVNGLGCPPPCPEWGTLIPLSALNKIFLTNYGSVLPRILRKNVRRRQAPGEGQTDGPALCPGIFGKRGGRAGPPLQVSSLKMRGRTFLKPSP